MSDLRALRRANVLRQREWDPECLIPPMFRVVELAGEVGEACNVAKKINRAALGLRGSRATVQELADELADILICVDLVAADYDIDLAPALARKFNATSDKVGLKVRLEL